MSVVYSTAAKNARLDGVINTIDAGSGAGVLQIGTSNMGTVLVSITLADPCGTAASGVLTFSSFPRSGIASATGTAAAARIRDSNANDVVTGLTVGVSGSGADIILDTTSIDQNETVTLNSATITAN